MHRFTFVHVAALVFALNSIPAFARSAADFQVLEKKIQELQAKVNELQKEQADSTVNYAGSATAAAAVIQQENKIRLAAGVTELKLFGDLRFRNEYDQFHPAVDVPPQAIDDRNRARFRVRFGTDVQLADQFFAAVTLAPSHASDSNTQTYTEGYDNYNTYIEKAIPGGAALANAEKMDVLQVVVDIKF
jgi:hypothetical protein